VQDADMLRSCQDTMRKVCGWLRRGAARIQRPGRPCAPAHRKPAQGGRADTREQP